MIKTCLKLASIFCASVGFAQCGNINVPDGAPAGVIDGVVMETHVPTKKVIPYANLRQGDYIWSRRVWRTIDLREKMNHSLYYPLQPINGRLSLWDILKCGIQSNSIVCYKPYDKDKAMTMNIFDGDQLRYPILRSQLSPEEYDTQISERLSFKGRYDSTAAPIKVNDFGEPEYDPKDLNALGQPNVYDAYITKEIKSEDILEYHIKEEWFFDKQRSVMDVRIIAIAPVAYEMKYDPIGLTFTPTVKRELFWVYFPEARYLLQNYFTYNEKNDARRMSFDDLFWKRKFQSYVDKESNVFDRDINDHQVGVDALLKSKEIETGIFKFEHDVWHF